MLRLINSMGTANASKGNKNADILTLKPKMAIIHSVKVVPSAAPKLTANDCSSGIKPALTKLTTIDTEAEELWINAVITIPVTIARKRFLVIHAKIERKRLPAVFCKPSLMIL